MEETNPLHINIYKDNKESISNSSNRTEEYIIIANEELNNKNRDLNKEVSELVAEKDIITDENERMEKSLTYQRGFLHNLHELNKLHKFITKNENELNKINLEEQLELKNILKNSEANTKMFITIIGIMLLVQCSIGLIDLYAVISIALTTVSVFYGMSAMDKSLVFKDTSLHNFDVKRKLISDIIKNTNAEINKITSSSDFISDYIEIM